MAGRIRPRLTRDRSKLHMPVPEIPSIPSPPSPHFIISNNTRLLAASICALLDIHATVAIISATGFFVAKAKSTDGYGGSWTTREKGSTSDVRLFADYTRDAMLYVALHHLSRSYPLASHYYVIECLNDSRSRTRFGNCAGNLAAQIADTLAKLENGFTFAHSFAHAKVVQDVAVAGAFAFVTVWRDQA
ncbi:hypothetical protein PENSPDRAFT_661392 [Peniophora sp. CONT]|nr:hypothetical protein PENSPDRAFT_661392 [Peniophora sp. CONT]